MTSATTIQAELRGRRRVRSTRRRVPQLLFRLYLLVLFAGAPFAFVAVQAVQTRASRLGAADLIALQAALGSWLPAGLALSCLAGLRFATWSGPVSFDEADLPWLLSAPVPRAGFVRPRLARGLGHGVALGLVLGALGWLTLILLTPAPTLPLLAACMCAGAALAGVTGAAAWAVERDARLACTVLWASPGVVLVALVLGATGSQAVATWSGPWGWAAAPILAAAGVNVPGWKFALGLLLALAAGGLTWALGAVDVRLEELRRRAVTSGRVGMGLYFLDGGSAAAARREGVAALTGHSRLSLPPPASPGLAIPWAGAVFLLRARGLLWRALALLGIAAGACVVATRSPITSSTALLALVVAAAAGYGATAGLVEPVRAERDHGFAARFLPWSRRELVFRHLITPAGILLALAMTGSAAAPAAAVGAATLVPGLLVAGVYGALREPPDPTLLLYGEVGAQMWLAQSGAALQVTGALTLPPAALGVAVLQSGADAWTAVLTGGGLALTSGLVALALLRRWLR